MQLNPKWGKTPNDLQSVSAKDAKNLVKKDLKRLEKNSSAEKPVPIAILGEHSYPDKPSGIALLLIGKWKGDFKKYAKEELVKEPLGAVGQVYFKGVGADGQKTIQIDLAKGKGKGKADKLAKGLKKLVPQATYNLSFGEMSEKALDQLEERMETLSEEEEVVEVDAEGDVEADGMDIQRLLDSNLTELSASLKIITEQVHPRLQARQPQDGDADAVVDTLDLANEWLEIWNETEDDAIKTLAKNNLAHAKVQNIIQKVQPLLAFLDKMGMNLTKTAATAPAGKTISGSVGKGGQNKHEDVKCVQELLNGYGYNLVVDGDCGKKTITAIADFQVKKAGLPVGDGRIDVGGKTWKALSANAPVNNNNNNNSNSNNTNSNNNTTPPNNNTNPNTNPVPAGLSGTVGKNATNAKADVQKVQLALYQHGQNIGIDGDCGNKTIAAIEAFQQEKGLPKTGVVDAATWTALQTKPTNPRPEDQEPVSGAGASGALGNTIVRKGTFVISLPPNASGAYPLVLLFAGKGQKADALIPQTPDSYFKEAILVYATASDNFGPAQTAYAPVLTEKGLSAASITICGYSLGGQAAFRNYSYATKAVGFIDPTTYYRDLEKIDSKAVFSTFPNMGWNWSARKPGDDGYLAMHAMRDGALRAQEKGGVGEHTKVGHGVYPKYFLAKFKSKLI